MSPSGQFNGLVGRSLTGRVDTDELRVITIHLEYFPDVGLEDFRRDTPICVGSRCGVAVPVLHEPSGDLPASSAERRRASQAAVRAGHGSSMPRYTVRSRPRACPIPGSGGAS
jgi:hypothetical protein